MKSQIVMESEVNDERWHAVSARVSNGGGVDVVDRKRSAGENHRRPGVIGGGVPMCVGEDVPFSAEAPPMQHEGRVRSCGVGMSTLRCAHDGEEISRSVRGTPCDAWCRGCRRLFGSVSVWGMIAEGDELVPTSFCNAVM